MPVAVAFIIVMVMCTSAAPAETDFAHYPIPEGHPEDRAGCYVQPPLGGAQRVAIDARETDFRRAAIPTRDAGTAGGCRLARAAPPRPDRRPDWDRAYFMTGAGQHRVRGADLARRARYDAAAAEWPGDMLGISHWEYDAIEALLPSAQGR